MARGFYTSKDKTRPIYRCSSKDGFTECIIMQETDASYILRKKENRDGKVVWTKGEWKRKTSVKLGLKIGEIFVDSYELKQSNEMDVESISAICPKCGFTGLVSLLKGYSWNWQCNGCREVHSKEEFEIVYNLIMRNVDEETETKSGEKLTLITNDCPNCDCTDNTMEDKVNKIIHCHSCGIYYVGGHVPGEDEEIEESEVEELEEEKREDWCYIHNEEKDCYNEDGDHDDYHCRKCERGE